MRIVDVICTKCEHIMYDLYLGINEKYPACEKCESETKFLPHVPNTDTFFEGSHNSEYNRHDRKYQGASKQQIEDQRKEMLLENKYVKAVKKAYNEKVKTRIKNVKDD